MEVVRGLAALPLKTGPTAVTVGFFDGVHRGHQAVVRRTVEAARERGLVPVAVTFDRHPREVLTPGREPPLLTTLERKASLLEALGVEVLVVLEFTEEFSRWPPEAFVERVLVGGLRAAHAVVGSNFTFGHRAAGNLPLLTELGAAHGFSVEGVGLLRLGGRAVSSSSIREALLQGDLAWPEEALGRRFVLDGRVVPGAGRGAALLGFPTANLEVYPRLLIPGAGIYAGRAFIRGEAWAAAVSVGTNPTFGGEPLHVEAHLLDFERDILGEPVAIEFWARLRDEVAFETVEDLVRQIKEDVERTRALVA
ncbi:MAG TPA: bifunctional riboflavin kinase/FAD synthetase [Actinomycetota bacterium]|nr:bifunctional riboflavin kinase/FAD synthetase [Actinomycetota bacterium]